jgi:hypothetical protein
MKGFLMSLLMGGLIKASALILSSHYSGHKSKNFRILHSEGKIMNLNRKNYNISLMLFYLNCFLINCHLKILDWWILMDSYHEVIFLLHSMKWLATFSLAINVHSLHPRGHMIKLPCGDHSIASNYETTF